ncbi:hypothetical protein EDC94DRAFT_663969 [Helicostylum pulchrum]|nr:hypothetical protein EDC94DRAFT_663969 [Helicostylum pulchrum]
MEVVYQIESNGEKFLKGLENKHVQDQATLEWISREIAAETTLHVPFVSYLKGLAENQLLIKLSCMNTMMAYLADIRDHQSNLFDAEVYQLLCTLLEQCYYTPSQWKVELDHLSAEKKKITLETYDNIIENYIYNPSQYPAKIELNPLLSDKEFILFNILYEEDMRPIQFENDDTFKFSSTWKSFLKNQAKYRLSFVVETQIIENALRKPEKKLACYSDLLEIVNTWSFCISDIDVMIKECLQSLLYSPASLISTITLCLLSLMQIAERECNEQVYHQYIGMCQAAWLKIFQSLLNDAVFENPQILPFQNSFTISKLTKYCSSFVQFYRCIQQNMDDFNLYLDNIWYQFLRTRRIYLNSTNTVDHHLIWLETVLFTGTTSLQQ